MEDTAEYRIGEVASLSGVSADSIRAWERRHGATNPKRDASNIRLYSEVDVERLRCLQQLIDRGARIGDIATLGLAQLQERLNSLRPATPQLDKEIPLILLGDGLNELFSADAKTDFHIIGHYTKPDEWLDAHIPNGVTAVVNFESAPPERIKSIVQGLYNAGARMILLLYHYAPSAVLEDLRKSGVMTMRSTTDPGELRHALLARHYWEFAGRRESQRYMLEPIPPPVLGTEQLARARSLCNILACECPRHLADIISSLQSFELYSLQCESATTKDAATHAMLHAATANARHVMESALLRLAEDEGWKDQLTNGQSLPAPD